MTSAAPHQPAAPLLLPEVTASPRPTHSPWGGVQRARQIIPGVWKVDTAGHGGVHVSAELLRLIPEPHRHRDGWYEEDQEWCIPWVLLGLPRENFWKEGTDHPNDTLRDCYPEVYEAHYGVTLQPGDSVTRDRAAFYDKHAEDYFVSAALGTWHNANIPEDQVGIVADKGGLGRNDTRYYLVPRSVYDQPRGRFGTLITDAYVQTDANFIPLERA